MSQSKPIAVGVHVFAGGMTYGVQQAGFHVEAQMERSTFGVKTVNQRWNVGVSLAPRWQEWPIVKDAVLVYGNPRCSGFSGLMLGYPHQKNKTRVLSGANACQAQDIVDLVSYATQIKTCQVIIIESVQQLYTSERNRAMLDWTVDFLNPRGYDVTHVLMNAIHHGVPQHRRRYFMVAHRGGPINITWPSIANESPTIDDVLRPRWTRQWRAMKVDSARADYDEDCCAALPRLWGPILPYLPPGRNLNRFAAENEELLERVSRELHEKWLCRDSDEPFGRFGPYRLVSGRHMGVLAGQASTFIHPEYDRALTIGECSALMGWPCIPIGPKPFHQLTKGVVPAAAKWIAAQALAYANGVRSHRHLRVVDCTSIKPMEWRIEDEKTE